ncbi:semaphorin-4G [Oncorhynchus mykiss]|uniref:Semaphorin 4G n=1 Tax=Oncorhynchus mykiss TaxID=8022 RepID=A0A8L0DSL0_ONCMY|nr:semaphorin-4G [Oncorhynchus mykiss]XP_036816231.1 semaphorin-4G [Oncorhynchus mykiss]
MAVCVCTTLPALLLLLGCGVCVTVGYPFRPPIDLDVTPRITITTSGLLGCRRFQSSVVNYSTLLLEEDKGLLYVGARGAAFSLNATDISDSTARTIEWEASTEQKQQCLSKGKDNKTECYNHIRFLQRFNSTHLYMCGTYAFRPLCAYIDEGRFKVSSEFEEGREKCPYGPATGYTGLIVDQQMYTASQYEFRGFPDVRRNFPSPTVRTEEAPTRWLHEADFVGSALVRESEGSTTGDDDKIYYFFTEKSQEQTPYYSHIRVARVGRVCKGDRGGLLTLQKRWTSFLKARLVCSLPEYDFHFNVLRSVYTLSGDTPHDTLFYGVFGLEWKNVKASAVCQFSLSELQRVFDGPYIENQDSGAKWSEYTGKVPDPRPGSCITDQLRSRGINSSTSLPDDVLNFVRRHPLMSQQVMSTEQRPLLFRRTTDYTQLAAHRVEGLDGQNYHVLFMGTDDGWLHRAVEVKGHLHIIEELQLFDQPQPVDSLVISHTQMSVYVGSPSGVVQLPLSTCSRYTSCYDCVFSRDPYCGWDGQDCVDITAQTDRSNLSQDVLYGNRGCDSDTADELVQHRNRSVMVGDDVLLQCELSSNLATPVWTLGGSELQGYGLDSGFRVGNDGLLVIESRPEQSGEYTCHALENGIRVAVVTYSVTVRLDMPQPRPPPMDPPKEDYSYYTPRDSDSSSLDPPPPPSAPPSSERPLLPPPPAHLPPTSELLSPRSMEAMYLSMITILGGLCLVLTVVLLYVGFCLRGGHRGKYSLRAAAAASANHTNRKKKHRKQHQKRHSSSTHLELKTISSHCNGNGICNGNGVSKQPGDGDAHEGGFLQIVPGEGQSSPNKDPPPPAPPLPPPPQTPHSALNQSECDLQDFPSPNGLSATLPSVLRRMHGNSYVLLRQSDADSSSPLCYSFTEELNRILEKRKHTQLLPKPDESSV